MTKAEEAHEAKLIDVVLDFPGLDKIPGYVGDYGNKVAKLLRKQRKHFLNGVKAYVAKDITLAALLIYLTGDLFATDEFAEENV